MLTPVDIQQKKFKVGLGYDKKDVNKFFEEVYESYAALYRSNAELKEKVINFNDRLQHYKTTEENLQKSLLLAEKNSEESKSNAEREAKAMELEARSRAEQIVKQATIDLKNMNLQMDELRDHYAEYKSKFAALLKEEFEFLGIKDFDTDMYIDPKYTERRKEQARRAAEAAEETKSFNNHNNGPDISNSSKVYGSVLGGEGIDPFHSNKESRYESSYTSSVGRESSFKSNSSFKQSSKEKKHNKYSVNSDDEGAGPSFRGGFSEDEKINLFRNERKKQEEAESRMKNDTASRINPDNNKIFTTETKKAEEKKAEEIKTEEKKVEDTPKFSDFVKPGPKVQREKSNEPIEESVNTEESTATTETVVESQETIEPTVESVEDRGTVTNATQIETESSLGDSVEFETVFNEAVDKAKTNDSLDDDDDFIFT